MAQRKYLIYLLLVAIFYSQCSNAAWNLGEGHTQIIGSAAFSSYNTGIDKDEYHSDTKTYDQLSQKIIELGTLKNQVNSDTKLTNIAKEHRVKLIDDDIKSLEQARQTYNKVLMKNMKQLFIAHGWSDNLTLGTQISYSQNSNYKNNQYHLFGGAIFGRYHLWHNKNTIYSMQVELGRNNKRPLYSNSNFVNLIFSRGKNSKLRKYDLANIMSFGLIYERAKYARGVRLDMTNIIKLTPEFEIMLQNIYTFLPKTNRLYRSTNYTEISLLHKFKLNEISDKMMSLQLGYFQNNSISAGKKIDNGIKIGLWLEF